MPDWPGLSLVSQKATISAGSECTGVGDLWAVLNEHMTAGAVWPAANRAYYIPFLVSEICTAYQMMFEVTVQSGNYDIGIYNENGSRLVSKTSTAVPAVGTAKADITDTVLRPGVYFMALCIDNGTAAVTRSAAVSAPFAQVCGIQMQAVGAVTLPDPAVFANPSGLYIPNIGVALQSTV